MDVLDTLGSTLGIGFFAGIRLYATTFLLGLSIRLGLFQPPPSMEHLDVLARTPILILAGAACLIEFFADKIPWLDSVWDSFHTIIRPIGAAFLAATALGHADPALKLGVVLLCGGIAFTTHSSKAATRLVANHSPEPFSNIALSLAGDVAVPFGLWFAMRHPLLMLAMIGAFVAAFAWISPKVFRLVRLEMVALWTWMTRGAGPLAIPARSVESIMSLLSQNASELPPAYAQILSERYGISVPIGGVRCAASRQVKGLRNSIGYLCLVNGELAFITQRFFRPRLYSIRLADLQGAELRRGLLMHRLVLQSGEENVFYLFRDFETQRMPAMARA